ncbi:peroxide stress protein YaaA [Agromyces intestinalis]|uniref:Peroxide stress protein YaaA n=1 Tax=Agromyces intestinalis TaxID=2592652 RepID=A0A5C1YEI7_9MICO|nr:peroxide stress protein YaaA [Agromyces intestinalis]QEO13427.1 peroxide stress protein YaaA [Agromyces intestinalis]
MLVLLPPSETKREGGDGAPLRMGALSFASLGPIRERVVDELVALATDTDATLRALKLGPRQSGEVERDRKLRSSPTMPAIDRYTGVLYDALDAATLDSSARAYARDHVAIHSALFGLVGALDPVPAYRLSHDSRIPGLRLKAVWREAIARAIEARPGLIVDLRSEGYAEVGPLPDRGDAVYVRVVSVDEGGRRRALNHFNKRAKGLFVHELLIGAPEGLATPRDLIEWAASRGFELGAATGERSGELELVA